MDFSSHEADTNDSRPLLRPPFLGLNAQSGADGYSCGALAWILAGALPSIGGAQVWIAGAFRLEYSVFNKTTVMMTDFDDVIVLNNAIDNISEITIL